MSATDFRRSIQQLEESEWGDPDRDATVMVQRCYALRKKPLCELTDDELRLAVGQEIGFPFVLDLAFERLENDPLLEGGCFPGDVLANLVQAPDDVWSERPELRERLKQHLAFALSQPPETTTSFREILNLQTDGNDVN